VQPPHLQGFSLPANAEFAENCGHVRPSSPVAATMDRKKGAICSDFAKPSDGLEPSTPLPVVRLPRKRCGVGSHGFS
jgi:hypothetical protein